MIMQLFIRPNQLEKDMLTIPASLFLLDDQNASQPHEVDWDNLGALKKKGNYWLHIFISDESDELSKVLLEAGLMPETVAEGLLADETHPRSMSFNHNLLLILRGVNPNPADLPSDMVSLRIWMTESYIISVSRQPIRALDEAQKYLSKMESASTVECLGNILWHLFSDIDEEIYTLDCLLDEVEQNVKQLSTNTIQESILSIRQQVISFRRYLLPQRDAIKRLPSEKISWLTDVERHQLKEYEDEMNRFVEYLNAVRERASVLQDRMLNRIQEDLNNKMCIVSIFALIFMPASFITGMFGMNIEIPDAYNNKYFFWIVMSFIVISTVSLYVYFRKRGWLRFS